MGVPQREGGGGGGGKVALYFSHGNAAHSPRVPSSSLLPSPLPLFCLPPFPSTPTARFSNERTSEPRARGRLSAAPRTQDNGKKEETCTKPPQTKPKPRVLERCITREPPVRARMCACCRYVPAWHPTTARAGVKTDSAIVVGEPINFHALVAPRTHPLCLF